MDNPVKPALAGLLRFTQFSAKVLSWSFQRLQLFDAGSYMVDARRAGRLPVHSSRRQIPKRSNTRISSNVMFNLGSAE